MAAPFDEVLLKDGRRLLEPIDDGDVFRGGGNP
jgi:hypothetical protein